MSSKRAYIIADRKLTSQRSKLKLALESAGWEYHEILVEAGEKLKELRAIFPIYGKLLRLKASRDSVIFALGGGSVGDAVGFIAATYLRGVSWVSVPTTLLSQVDSAVGGKTGINHPLGKNLIGSFHQPTLVICDIDFLLTLSRREVISGFGEIIKYAIAFDKKFYRYLTQNISGVLRLDPKVIQKVVFTSLAWKCKMVQRDELDKKGIREILNLGHTFGHVLESWTHYNVYQHGEAVIWGLRFALALSEIRGVLNSRLRLKLDFFLLQLPVGSLPKGLKGSDLWGQMQHDKKVRQGLVHFVLVKRIGKTVSDSAVKKKHVVAAYRLLTGGSS